MAPRRRPTAFEVSFPDEVQAEDNVVTGERNKRTRSGSGEQLEGPEASGSRRRNARDEPPRHPVYYRPPSDEIRENEDLLVIGEDLDNDGPKPIRILSRFSFFNAAQDLQMLPLSVLEGEDCPADLQLEGAGIVQAVLLNDEDQGQEDDIDVHGDQPQFIRLSQVLNYTIDYKKKDDPICVETGHAMYQIISPSKRYEAFFRPFYTKHRILQEIISAACSPPIISFANFMKEVSSFDVLGRALSEADVWNSIPDLKLALEQLEGADEIRGTELVTRLLRTTQPPLRIRAPPASAGSNDFDRMQYVQTRLLNWSGSLDLAVLHADNQHDIHVTPFVASMATGLFRGHLKVVGPPPQPTRPIESQLPQIRAFIESARRRRRIRFRLDQQILRSSSWMKSVEIDDEIIALNDVVVFAFDQRDKGGVQPLPKPEDVPADAVLADFFWFAKVISIRKDHERMHVQWFEHSSKTAMQEICDPQELFLTETCDDIPLIYVLGKIRVCYLDSKSEASSIPSGTFYYKFVYNDTVGTYSDVNHQLMAEARANHAPKNCSVCLKLDEIDEQSTAREIRNGITYLGVDFHINDFVLLKAVEGPCSIGQVAKISVESDRRHEDEFIITVKMFGRVSMLGARPDNVLKDERHLFSTDMEKDFGVQDLIGMCYIFPTETMPPDWLSLSPTHFHVGWHFPSLNVASWGQRRRLAPQDLPICTPCIQEKLKQAKSTREFLSVSRQKPLRAFDPFGGVGAFGLAFEHTGCVKVTHSVEISPSAAKAMKSNSPHTVVYNQCANVVLRYAIKTKEDHDFEAPRDLHNNAALPRPPQPGDIDCIITGFPCQSHSRLNMFPKAQDTKSNLILNVLSWVDFLRPNYCIFENVRGFLQFNLRAIKVSRHKLGGGIAMGGLKFLIRALVALGYQVRFGLLQAAHYGTPQSRVRFFLIAAKRNFPLPWFPVTTHEFPPTESLEIKLPIGHNIRSVVVAKGTGLHPYVTIDDAIGDLPRFDWRAPNPPNNRVRNREDGDGNPVPAVKCDKSRFVCGLADVNAYKHEPRTNFQVWCRRVAPDDLQHYTRTYDPEKVQRVISIPLEPRADYRSLKPEHWEWQLFNPSSASARQSFRPGMYGRLDQDGWFSTTVTNVDPTAKQSRVLNPYCQRILTVRELARSQGFPDYFKFYSIDDNINVVTMHRQIGNAVPWPVSIAIGLELRAALVKKWAADGHVVRYLVGHENEMEVD